MPIAPSHPASLEALLGIERPVSVSAVLARGLPWDTVERMGSYFGMTSLEIRAAIGAERATQAEARLDATETDRAWALAAVLLHAETVFGSPDRAGQWLHTAVRALSGRTPISRLGDPGGIELVDDVLGRIEHGIPA